MEKSRTLVTPALKPCPRLSEDWNLCTSIFTPLHLFKSRYWFWRSENLLMWIHNFISSNFSSCIPSRKNLPSPLFKPYLQARWSHCLKDGKTALKPLFEGPDLLGNNKSRLLLCGFLVLLVKDLEKEKKKLKDCFVIREWEKKNRVGKLQILAAGRRKGWGREGKAMPFGRTQESRHVQTCRPRSSCTVEEGSENGNGWRVRERENLLRKKRHYQRRSRAV